MSQIDELLNINDKIKKDVRKRYGVTENDVNDNINCLKTWLSQTPHLPEEKSNEWLEYFLIRHKMSLERTKIALESYYTARSVIANYFDKLVPHNTTCQKAKLNTCVIVIPELTRDYSRITIHKITNDDAELYDPMESIIMLLMLSEIRMCKDFNYSDIVVLDLSGYSLKHLVKFTPKVIRKLRYIIMVNTAYELIIRILPSKLKTLNFNVISIHIINVPHFTDKILPIFRGIIPGKIYKKVHVHTTIESLHQHVPSEYLPADYDGHQKSLLELYRKWCEELELWEPYFAERMYIKSDESKRIGRNHEFEIFGTGSQGSFKKIEVDL